MTAVDGCADAGAFAWAWDDELPSYICAQANMRRSEEAINIYPFGDEPGRTARAR